MEWVHGLLGGFIGSMGCWVHKFTRSALPLTNPSHTPHYYTAFQNIICNAAGYSSAGHCVGFPGDPPLLGASLQQTACDGSSGQEVRLVYIGNTSYCNIVTLWGNCWTVPATSNGFPWENQICTGLSNQAFLIQPVIGTVSW